MNDVYSVLSGAAGKRFALSLVEVLAALVIMGGVVTSLLLVQARSIEQVQGARLALDAQQIARELVTEWRLQEAELQSNDKGTIGPEESWRWERRVRRVENGNELSAVEVTLRLEATSREFDRDRWSREFVWLISDEGE